MTEATFGAKGHFRVARCDERATSYLNPWWPDGRLLRFAASDSRFLIRFEWEKLQNEISAERIRVCRSWSGD